MSGFTITITDAGRAALINAQNTGTNAFTLSQIGVSSQAIATPLQQLTALPNERKKLATFAGDVVADDTLHVTIRDESADAYALRAFGIYTSVGTLFAVYSQLDPIIEKSAAAMLLLAVDARLVEITTELVEFGPAGFTLPPASETVAGISEVATDAECDAGTDNWRFITPRLLKRALQALSGFALIDHTHDAADTNSGTFNAARIPLLAMEKISGLADALAAKAAAVHTHTIAQITGLADALAAKAAAVHAHHADDINQGVLAVARIPSLAMDKITGLAAALLAKSDVGHKHDASDTNSGTFAVARIPSLAMDKINGLVAALGEKAPSQNPNLTGNVQLSPYSVFLAQGGNEGGQFKLAKAESGTVLTGDIIVDIVGDSLRIFESTSPARGVSIDISKQAAGIGAQAWTSTTLPFATAAEAANGNVINRMLSPAGLWSFPRSMGASGYQQIPGTELIIQWGVTNASIPEGPVQVTLPVAFGGGSLVAIGIPRNAAQNTSNDYYVQVVGRYRDRVVFMANRANTQSYNMTGFEWMVIGRAYGTPDPEYSSGGGGGDGGGGGGGGGDEGAVIV